MNSGKISIELQRKLFEIPEYKKYFKLMGGYQENGLWIQKYDLMTGNPEDNIPKNILDIFLNEVDVKHKIHIRVISDQQNISDFIISDKIKRMVDKDIIFSQISIAEFNIEKKNRQQESERNKSFYSFNTEEQIEDELDYRFNIIKELNKNERLLAAKVSDLLNEKPKVNKNEFITGDLDCKYLQKAPENWPNKIDLPESIKKLLGKQYSKHSLKYAIDHGEELYSDEELEERVGNGRAWSMPILQDKLIYFENYESICNTLETFIQNLTQLPFVLSKATGYGGIGIYRHLHTEAALAFREDLPNIIYLELYGLLRAVNGKDFSTKEYEEYLVRKKYSEGKLFIPDGPLVIQMLNATLSNYSYPGVGVPLYL